MNIETEKVENGYKFGEEPAPHGCAPGVKPNLLTYDDIRKMVPFLDGKPRLVRRIAGWLGLDESNRIHRDYCYETGVPFTKLLVDEEFRIKKRIDNEEVLSRFPEGPFVIISNHALGALDGILLIDIVGRHRPDYKMMVNMFLNYITAMHPVFIAVDPLGSDDPAKKAQTMHGIREAISHVRNGHPIGFFPAGAVSKLDMSLHVKDRPWQESIIRLIKQMKVPVIPAYFHETNSWFFNLLGVIDWRLRTLRLPKELFRKRGKEIHVSFGEPIMPDEQSKYTDLKEFGQMLRKRTYELKEKYPD